jgi:hypothetical protein
LFFLSVVVLYHRAGGAADYERLYPIYRQLYPALQATFRELAAFEAE